MDGQRVKGTGSYPSAPPGNWDRYLNRLPFAQVREMNGTEKGGQIMHGSERGHMRRSFQEKPEVGKFIKNCH